MNNKQLRNPFEYAFKISAEQLAEMFDAETAEVIFRDGALVSGIQVVNFQSKS